MMAVQPFTYCLRVGAQSIEGSSVLSFSIFSNCGLPSRMTATEQFAVP